MTGDAFGKAELLPWDTDFFGIRIARVSSGRLDEPMAASIDEWCRGHGVECLYFLADLDDPGTMEVVSARGYTAVDVRVTLSADAPLAVSPAPSAPPVRVRMVSGQDRDGLRAIAAGSFDDSRFYFDRHFPRDRCDALYDTWLLGEVGAALDDSERHAVVVAEMDGRVAGFVTCELVMVPADSVTSTQGRIGLVGVDRDARGRGVARTVLGGALSWLDDRGVETVSVVTQGRNVGAQRLYQQQGFRTSSVQAWFHKWFT